MLFSFISSKCFLIVCILLAANTYSQDNSDKVTVEKIKHLVRFETEEEGGCIIASCRSNPISFRKIYKDIAIACLDIEVVSCFDNAYMFVEFKLNRAYTKGFTDLGHHDILICEGSKDGKTLTREYEIDVYRKDTIGKLDDGYTVYMETWKVKMDGNQLRENFLGFYEILSCPDMTIYLKRKNTDRMFSFETSQFYPDYFNNIVKVAENLDKEIKKNR